jgi:hypothetical protein
MQPKNNNILGNGRQPHFFLKMEEDLKKSHLKQLKVKTMIVALLRVT